MVNTQLAKAAAMRGEGRALVTQGSSRAVKGTAKCTITVNRSCAIETPLLSKLLYSFDT